METERVWDVAVIGGGPAGMMAAGRAAEQGARVILLEKNRTLGRKLLITGGGRCNVTNAEPDVRKLLSHYKSGGKFLASPFSEWNASTTIEFFEKRGMPIKIEAEQRAFPASNTAQSVFDTLLSYVHAHKVTIASNAPIVSLTAQDGAIVSAQIAGGNTIRARSFILATGGLSRPETGSTGDGFKMLKKLGHSVDESGGALVPLALKKTPLLRAAGVSMKNAKLTVLQDGVKQRVQSGKMLFTHVGISGPAVLNMSRMIGELLIHGAVEIEIDLLPDQGYEKVDAQLQATFKEHANKMVRNALSAAIAPALVSPILQMAGIESEKMCNSVTRDERVRLMKTLKHLETEVDHLLGLEKAVVTSGGLALTEIDFKTMRSQKYGNLYIVGDLLDIDRPSGGYSLQLCWTTGFVAGTAAATATRTSQT